MTATFGKLDHETLTLEPGLNILEAPNEWGKSTWCAFLTAMLYGLDTRAKTTKAALSDKEHYAPWSGKPMSGRVDLNWNGRDITIERTTKGRMPMGIFRAYETETGLEVPELNAANCGPMLLGVERSVFVRSAFLRLSDLPVSDDEALRRRLNALVTTGDESGRAERLSAELKELKNRIRYNRTGLLPQAEAEKDQLERVLLELNQLREQQSLTQKQMAQLREQQLLLENHRSALEYSAEEARKAYRHQAQQDLERSRVELEQLEEQCQTYPDRETVLQVLEEIRRLQQEGHRLEGALAELKEPRQPEVLLGVYFGMTGEQAISSARADRDLHWALSERPWWLLVMGVLLMVCGGAALCWYRIPGLVCGVLGLAVLLLDLLLDIRRRRRKQALEARYGGQIADRWLRQAEQYARQMHQFQQEKAAAAAARRELQEDLTALRESVESATQGRGLDACQAEWRGVLEIWNRHQAVQKNYRQAEQYFLSLQTGPERIVEPGFPDLLEDSPEETQRKLQDCSLELQRLENRLGLLQGRMDALGDSLGLEKRLEAVKNRIGQLESTYAALTVAQDTLGEAALDLQRRFAPRIARQARDMLEKLTGGRYDKLHLSDDLSLRAGAGEEDTLREVLWRSDGTVDQLYLALRLAVAGELAPEAPLILDDALARFDDVRVKAALEILSGEAENRQVLLFTCHSREKRIWDSL